ncbi:MAG: class I SAM-dependent methyltransferase [Thermodesulfobacteriota bacterium]|nr:class I SAM-dependent methyltransferase [Thermodesulfobacteriota bacterium]
MNNSHQRRTAGPAPQTSPTETTLLRCPLCADIGGSSHFHSDQNRDYYCCPYCHLVHVPPPQLLSPEAERAEYDKHQNSPHDAGYRKFLSRLFIPLNTRLSPGSHGLDFGSGPGPTLSLMFEEAGHRMSLFDPFYAPKKNALNRQYDFISASEVVEHLHDPKTELALLWAILKPGGWLGIMTKLVLDRASFSQWHYKNDPTHVCFYSIKTMAWLARQWQVKLLPIGKDVLLFQKPL